MLWKMATCELMISASVRQSRQSEGWRGLWSRGLTSRSHHGSTFACDVEWRKGRTFTIHQSNTADTGQQPSDLVKQSPPSWDCWRSTMRVLHFLCPCTATSSVCSLALHQRVAIIDWICAYYYTLIPVQFSELRLGSRWWGLGISCWRNLDALPRMTNAAYCAWASLSLKKPYFTFLQVMRRDCEAAHIHQPYKHSPESQIKHSVSSIDILSAIFAHY